jgi:hypothetical protein
MASVSAFCAFPIASPGKLCSDQLLSKKQYYGCVKTSEKSYFKILQLP